MRLFSAVPSIWGRNMMHFFYCGARCRRQHGLRRYAYGVFRFVAATALSLAVFGFEKPVLAQGAQTPPPTSLSGVFLNEDSTEVTPTGLAALKGAAEKAKAAADCYPPRVTFTAQSKYTMGDKSFNQAVASVRGDALKAVLPSLGLDADQVQGGHPALADSDDVRVSYDPFNRDDKDPPKLKVTSTPKKGTKVKPGDKIKVTIKASERYRDGHKSWPTGVQNIQLIADDGLVDSKDYGRPPQPCARQTFEVTYTVPKNPPAIVHLRAIAEDAVGNQASEVGEFPTGDTWKGTMSAEAVYVVEKQRCTDRWNVDMTVAITKEDKVAGDATAKRAANVKCTYQYPVNQTQTVGYRLEGSRDKTSLHLRFVPKNYQPSGSIDVTGFGHLLQGHGMPRTVDIPIVSQSDAKGHVSFKETIGKNIRNVSGEASLKCTTC
jgi:hypothetical protein